jgi:hypothetical protein
VAYFLASQWREWQFNRSRSGTDSHSGSFYHRVNTDVCWHANASCSPSNPKKLVIKRETKIYGVMGPPSLSLPLGMAIGLAILPMAAWWHGESRNIVLVYITLFVLIMIRRATAGLGSELKGGVSPLNRRLINRLLYDSSTL